MAREKLSGQQNISSKVVEAETQTKERANPPLTLFLLNLSILSLAIIVSCPDYHCSQSVTISFLLLLQIPETSNLKEKTVIWLTVLKFSYRTNFPMALGL